MVISKYLSGNTPTSFNIANFPHNGVAQVWQLTAANAISRLTDVSFSGNTFGATLPAQSITLFVLSVASGNQSPVAVMAAAPTSGVAPLNVSFDGGSSSDADGSIVSYAWNFGDSATGSGVTTNHTYSMSGTYIARLTVTDNRGASSSSTATIQVNTIPPTIPAAPSNLLASALSKTQISLSWTDNSANETGFRIERCAGANCTNFIEITTVGANIKNYTNTGLKRNTTYRYRVRAFNSAGSSAYSNTATAATPR
jgi:PKD repeat protein